MYAGGPAAVVRQDHGLVHLHQRHRFRSVSAPPHDHRGILRELRPVTAASTAACNRARLRRAEPADSGAAASSSAWRMRPACSRETGTGAEGLTRTARRDQLPFGQQRLGRRPTGLGGAGRVPRRRANRRAHVPPRLRQDRGCRGKDSAGGDDYPSPPVRKLERRLPVTARGGARTAKRCRLSAIWSVWPWQSIQPSRSYVAVEAASLADDRPGMTASGIASAFSGTRRASRYRADGLG